MAVLFQVKVHEGGLGLWPIGCTPALSVTQKRHCSCSMQLVVLYNCDMPTPSGCYASTKNGCFSASEAVTRLNGFRSRSR